MRVVQNAGIAAANLVAGALNDGAAAGPLNPGGYGPMMNFIGVSSVLGLPFALAPRVKAGRQRHKLPQTVIASPR